MNALATISIGGDDARGFLSRLMAGEPGALILAGAGLGALVLVILLLGLAFRRKKPKPAAPRRHAEPVRAAAPARAPAAPPAAKPMLIADFLREGIEVWRYHNGGPARGAVEEGLFKLRRGEAARSLASLPAVAGRRYRLEFSARALKDSANGNRNNFFVGPMFLDAEGKVVGWFAEQAPIELAEGARVGAVEREAPAGAVSVHISVQGSHARDPAAAGDGVIAFSELRLSEI